MKDIKKKLRQQYTSKQNCQIASEKYNVLNLQTRTVYATSLNYIFNL